jgi:hypothetical protein
MVQQAASTVSKSATGTLGSADSNNGNGADYMSDNNWIIVHLRFSSPSPTSACYGRIGPPHLNAAIGRDIAEASAV